MTISNSQAWAIHYDKSTLSVRGVWEHTEPEYIAKWGHCGGLVLAVCPHCGNTQTRANYVEGFWADNVELVTDYECTGIAKCAKCGKWCNW